MPEVRESRLLQAIYRASLQLPPRVLVGPGDDMAVISVDAGQLLVAVDQVVEGRHFVAGTDEALIAHKAIARNLSDVAAMAARPVATLAACTLPESWSQSRAEKLFEAIRRAAEVGGCPLVGGDISTHASGGPLVVSVTILAEPWPEALSDPAIDSVIRRHRAQDGDGVFVTGRLGGSLGADGLGRHLRFEPRVAEARELRQRLGASLHSMIDLSDGLGRDAAALVDGHHQVLLDGWRLPLAEGCDWRHALADGEDYELCFAAAGAVPEQLVATGGGELRVTRVGCIRRRPSGSDPACVVAETKESQELLDASVLGWDHGSDGQ